MKRTASKVTVIRRDAQWYAGKIAAAWQKAVPAIIEAGRWLIKAKDGLPHGEFLPMIAADLPFGRMTAIRLMAIAGHPQLSNVTHGQHLPPSWRTLYEISRLDEGEFGLALERGVIHPGCERKHIVAFRKELVGDGKAPPITDGCTVPDLQALIGDGKTFPTIYADPPWKYGNQATRAATDNHYKTLTIDELCDLPIAVLAPEEGHLHLWTTNAFLFDAKRVLEAWGFEYKSCFVWVKPQMGIGNYWRVSHEFLLLGIRGGLRFTAHDCMSWLEADRIGHSRKPEAVRMMIERTSKPPRLELFGRRAVEGWTVWGNEISRDLFTQSIDTIRSGSRVGIS